MFYKLMTKVCGLLGVFTLLWSVASFASTTDCSQCYTTYDYNTGILHVPNLYLNGQVYSIDLQIIQFDPDVIFKLVGASYGDCEGGSSVTTNTCSDCSCADYAASHPSECGQTGKLNFRIVWHDTNDVDLHAEYYETGYGYENKVEEIYYQKDKGEFTGGELDVDANAGCSSTTTSPVENIVYENPSPGVYKMKVCGYQQCGSNSNSSVTVQVLVNGQIVWQNTITISEWGDTCVDVYTYTLEGEAI